MTRGLLVGLAVLASLAVSCGGKSSDAAPAPTRPPTPVYIEYAKTEDVRETIVVSGIVEAAARIELGFRIDGFVESFSVDEGDRVEAGAVIATLDLEDLQRQVNVAETTLQRAKAAADEAKLLFERQEGLYKTQNASQQVYDRARLAYEMADAEARSTELQLEAAQDHLKKGVLRAPITGYIEARLLEAHESARAGVPVVVLTELDHVKVRAAVADMLIGGLHIGSEARVTTPAWPGREFIGTIARIAVAADSQTRTVPFEVDVANDDLALRSELVVDVHVQTGESRFSITLPASAILRDAAETPFCFVAGGPPTAAHAERRPVTLGAIHGDRIIIKDGLDDGAPVIVRGQHFIREGDPVAIGNL